MDTNRAKLQLVRWWRPTEWRISAGIWPKNRKWGYIFRYVQIGPFEVRYLKPKMRRVTSR